MVMVGHILTHSKGNHRGQAWSWRHLFRAVLILGPPCGPKIKEKISAPPACPYQEAAESPVVREGVLKSCRSVTDGNRWEANEAMKHIDTRSVDQEVLEPPG